MIFPPIFAYVGFFILDLIAFVFDITGIFAEVGIFISSLATFAYFGWVFVRYGPKKMSEKLFNWRKGKVFKKVMKTVGGSIVPFVNVWAVYDDYKQELEDAKNKELEAEGVVKEEKKKGLSLKQKIALGAAAAATGGAALAAEGVIAGEAVAGEAAASGALEAGAARGALAGEEAAGSRWIKSNSKNISKNPINKKTISEEIGGIKTGLERSDYESGATDFSNIEAYENLLKERAQEKLQNEIQRKEIEDTNNSKKKREEIEKKNAFDREFIRRFGTAAYERMKRERDANKLEKEENLETEDTLI